jgi:hypothetical protein
MDWIKEVEGALKTAWEYAEREIHGQWDEDAMLAEKQIAEALSALRANRGAGEWMPIAELPNESDDEFYVGGWFTVAHGHRWQQALCAHISKGARERLIGRGYTHFYRPILPPPPKRDAEPPEVIPGTHAALDGLRIREVE